jgi:hypothetical protein
MKRIGLPILANAFPTIFLIVPMVLLRRPCEPKQQYQYFPKVAVVS